MVLDLVHSLLVQVHISYGVFDLLLITEVVRLEHNSTVNHFPLHPAPSEKDHGQAYGFGPGWSPTNRSV